MSLQNIKDMKAERGFTIVELLIVIVIIGILAAIVIVAYNGITDRARVSGYQSDANSIVKVAEAINAEKGDYPTAAETGGKAFTVTGTFNTAKLPNNVLLNTTPIAATAADPTDKAGAGPSETNGVKTYNWKACGADAGVMVFYWDGSAVKTVTAGTACPV